MISQKDGPAADQIWSNLWVNYGVEINKDWGDTNYRVIVGHIRGVPIYETRCGGWALGSWRTPDELKLVEEAVIKISDAMGGPGNPAKFRSAFGRVRLARWNDKLNKPPASPPGVLSAYADTVLTNYTFDYGTDYAIFTTIHELGHVWDSRSGYGLSKGLVSALNTMQCYGQDCIWDPSSNSEVPPGALQGCTVKQIAKNENSCGVISNDPAKNTYPYAFTYGGGGPFIEGPGWEDWADSFADFLYPQYYQNWSPRRTNLARGGIRELYVRFQIEHIK
jgi:hypothetical protein